MVVVGRNMRVRTVYYIFVPCGFKVTILRYILRHIWWYRALLVLAKRHSRQGYNFRVFRNRLPALLSVRPFLLVFVTARESNAHSVGRVRLVLVYVRVSHQLSALPENIRCSARCEKAASAIRSAITMQNSTRRMQLSSNILSGLMVWCCTCTTYIRRFICSDGFPRFFEYFFGANLRYRWKLTSENTFCFSEFRTACGCAKRRC